MKKTLFMAFLLMGNAHSANLETSLQHCLKGGKLLEITEESGKKIKTSKIDSFISSCEQVFSDSDVNNKDRSIAMAKYANLYGRKADMTSNFRFITKLELGKIAYGAVKKALEIDPYNFEMALAMARTVKGFYEKGAPGMVLKSVGIQDVDAEIKMAYDYLCLHMDDNQKFIEIDPKLEKEAYELYKYLGSI